MAKQDTFKVKSKVYDRYSDDQDFVIRSFEWRVKFYEESDKRIEKNEQQIYDEKNKPEDELLKNKKRQIYETIQPMLKNRTLLS